MKGGGNMENKKEFVKKLSTILVMYSREKIKKIEYINTNGEELVCITYVNGRKQYIYVWGDSCVAIMNDICRALMR